MLIDAVSMLPGVRLTIVGDGPNRRRLIQQVEHSAARDRITIEGFCAHDELPTRYRTFDAVAVPSLTTPTWVEQFGRVAVEAMASGVPVVVSDSGSLPGVVGSAGLLARPGDAAHWAEQLQLLHDDPAVWSRCAVAGRTQAERFSWPSVAREQADLYREVAA